jgi:hypothetical protein
MERGEERVGERQREGRVGWGDWRVGWSARKYKNRRDGGKGEG